MTCLLTRTQPEDRHTNSHRDDISFRSGGDGKTRNKMNGMTQAMRGGSWRASRMEYPANRVRVSGRCEQIRAQDQSPYPFPLATAAGTLLNASRSELAEVGLRQLLLELVAAVRTAADYWSTRSILFSATFATLSALLVIQIPYSPLCNVEFALRPLISRLSPEIRIRITKSTGWKLENQSL